MKRLQLHIGTHKTGTTAFQHTLFEDRKRLSAAGIRYDTAKPNLHLGKKRAHHWLAHALARFDKRDQDVLAKYRKRLLNAPEQTILVSSETFWRHVDLSRGASPKNPDQFIRARGSYLDRLAEYFSPFQTEISVYLRRPDKFAASLYKEQAVSNALDRSFQEFLCSSPAKFLFQYQTQMDEWQSRFDNVAAKCFEKAREYGLIDAMYKHHGLPALAESLPPGPRRGSVSARAALWLVRAKQTAELSEKDRRRRWVFALSEQTGCLFRGHQTETFWVNDAERQDFVKKTLEGFEHTDFWVPSKEHHTSVCWTKDDHAKAEHAFSQWQTRNQAYLRTRELMGLPPYVDDAAMKGIGPRVVQFCYRNLGR